MLDLNELEQLIAFADTGTLSKVAEAFHISTPSVTRSKASHKGWRTFRRSETDTCASHGYDESNRVSTP